MMRGLPVLFAAVVLLTGCTSAVQGAATWPGERLERVLLTAADFPDGVQFDRVIENPGEPDGAGAPPAMLSDPPGCSEGFTKVITATAERGPGSAAKYTVGYDGARMLITVLSWPLDTDALEATAQRCARFSTFFDRGSPPIPMTTTRLETARPDALVYEQTMDLSGARSSVYFSFENVDSMAVFAVAFPTPNPAIGVKATLPQTFLEATGKQAQRLEAP
ncbi:hypothetical protein V4U86_16910 [Mycobacterium sp. AMU20-3851]|uniref:hypothetical protein n=1 Tax=Mycobacterium sp. AMU20-3851 TaxID=3122055 RepID=UPI00375530E4